MNKEILIKEIKSNPEIYGRWINLNSKTIEQLLDIIQAEDPELAKKELDLIRKQHKQEIPQQKNVEDSYPNNNSNYNTSNIRQQTVNNNLNYETSNNYRNLDNQNIIVKIENLKKSFKKKEVHKGINLEIIRGETLAIIGANGAGKTVLMETLVRVQKQNEGMISFDFNGEDPFEEIGMQFQDADSSTKLKPAQMVKFIKMMYKNKVDTTQLNEMIDIYGIREYYKRPIKKLSGGQKQRVNLLLATMHNPRFMILDEFITGLDILSVQGILKYIEKLKAKNNSTLVIISHQPEEIKNLADRVAILKDGVIKMILTKEQIIREYNGDYTKFLLENI